MKTLEELKQEMEDAWAALGLFGLLNIMFGLLNMMLVGLLLGMLNTFIIRN